MIHNRTESDSEPDQKRPQSGPKADRIRTTVGRHASQAVPAMKFAAKSSGDSPQVTPRLGASPKRSHRMDLTPKLPPGRANRKALAFVADIHRLRAAGYSFEAIRVALLEAGVKVSRTTVKREAARRRAAAQSAPQRLAALPSVPLAPSGADDAVTPPASFIGDSRSGKEIAEAFMKGRSSNPLMQERNRDESRSD